MKKKHVAWLAGLLGAGALLAGAKYYADEQELRKKSEMLKQVRAQFEKIGEIAVAYVDETASRRAKLVGGVVLENGRIYQFTNRNGKISYEEEAK